MQRVSLVRSSFYLSELLNSTSPYLSGWLAGWVSLGVWLVRVDGVDLVYPIAFFKVEFGVDLK